MPCAKSLSILIPTPTPRSSKGAAEKTLFCIRARVGPQMIANTFFKETFSKLYSFGKLLISKSFVTSRASIRHVSCNLCSH